MVTRMEPYDIVANGDVIDGVHHQSTTQISHNIEDQLRIAESILRPVVEHCQSLGGRFYQTRGTEAHVGPSGVHEEMLAQRLGAIPNEAGQYARHELWKRVGGALVHLLHHIGTTSSAAHEASAVNAELTAGYVEAARWGQEPADFTIRSHRHRFIAVDLDTSKGYGASIVTPGWQLKTPVTFRFAGSRNAEPQFGGVAVRFGDEEHYYRRWVKSIGRSREE
jgi:hypothetical protein